MAGTGFRSRSTNMKPQKAGFPKLRRGHGSTSSSLANMHPNSGSNVRSQRQGGKERVQVAQLAKKPEESNHEIATKNMPGAEIAQLIGRKEETVRK